MSQQVLCCYDCGTYQVCQVKKDNKWVCKVCNEKQSMKQIFGRGSGPECRKLVQHLNLKRGTLDFEDETQTLNRGNEKMAFNYEDEEREQYFKVTSRQGQEQDSKNVQSSTSMWSKYL